MDARLRFQFLLSVLLVVLFIEFYNNVGPEVELLSTYLFWLGSQQGNLSAKLAGNESETETKESRREEKDKIALMRTLRQLQASQVCFLQIVQNLTDLSTGDWTAWFGCGLVGQRQSNGEVKTYLKNTEFDAMGI